MGFFNKSNEDFSIEEACKDRLIVKLKNEIESLKKQLKFEEDLTEGFVLKNGEYMIGTDLKPGRYSFKLIYGDYGRLETTGRNWVIENLGDKWNGISEYNNLSLKSGQKLILTGNVKILMKEESPINMDKLSLVIEEKDKEIKDLKNKINCLKKELNDFKESYNEMYFKEDFSMTAGTYIGGENIKTGYYDLIVISGKGILRVDKKYIYEKMGTGEHDTKEYKGLKVSRKLKIEVSGNIIINANLKNIQYL